MSDPLEIVWGWKEIARVLGRSVCYAQSRSGVWGGEPLTMFWEDDRPGAYVQALLGWRARQRHSHRTHRELATLRAELRGRAPHVQKRDRSKNAA